MAKVEKPRLQVKYEEVKKQLMTELGYKNINEVPKLEKIVLNMGLGDVKDNSKSFNLAVEELGLITGQKPIVTKAKKSISNFKLRQNQSIGAKVTLRSANMYEFLDRFISVVLPRVRDFDGVSTKSFDGRGNYNLGIKEQLIFPEISYENFTLVWGVDICFVKNALFNE